MKTNPSNPIKIATTSTILLLAFVLSGSVSLATERDARHRLQVEISPQEQKLRAIDEITIEKIQSDRLDFKLSRRAEQIEVTVDGNPRGFDFKNGQLSIHPAAG